jgi:glycosyltransferase involved in cell wall biosynthesis
MERMNNSKAYIPENSLSNMDKPRFDYSVIVPLKDEEANVEQLDNEIKSVVSKLGSFEIIYVDDGSKDNTLNNLKKLKNVKILALNKNYGQSIALDAGFKACKGNIVISLDGDLQNDPKDIPKLLKKLKEENLDVVAGWRKDRKDKRGIRILTKTGRFLRKRIIHDNVHDTGCMLRVYKREAVKTLDLHGEMHRYILALLRWKGFKIGEEIVAHRPRIHGQTKYGYDKAVRGFIDLIYIWFINKYSSRPLHLFGTLGLWSFFIGVLSGVYAIYTRFAENLSLNRNGWFFLFIFFTLAGIMFFSFGIIMDIVLRIYLNTSPTEKRYYVRDVLES